MIDLIYFLFIGGLAGWIVGKLTRGRGFGVARNILIGVVGAILGGFILRILGFSHAHDLIPELLTAILGAFVFLALLGQFATSKRRK